jgi:EAL domain-containing protein (putative c-di-GMP-specific phosphodiesterase class I)/ActR/RegA family two-component response regulator
VVYDGRILILEDDMHVGKIMKLIAEANGLETRLVADPGRFFSALDEWHPTHIALDLVMPDMDGVEVLVELAKRDCGAKIIITSGLGARVLDAAGRSGHERGLNVVGVLAKPFSATALRELLFQAPGRAAVRAPSQDRFHATETELRNALANHEFRVVYQPRIECASGDLAGFEALARWIHPERGLVMPDHFIPLMESSGLIDLLTDAVLDQSLAWFSGFPSGRDDAYGAVSLSVNLSAQTFADPTFLERVTALCSKFGVAPQRIIFEVTETNHMDDSVASLDLMTRIRMKGFHLSIDDFGTGYSSLLQLVRLPFSEIKVDRSFVTAAMRSVEARTVVKSIVDLGRSLGLKSAAEGVEDTQTLDLLRRIGCDLAQGFSIAPPMDGDAALHWVEGLH